MRARWPIAGTAVLMLAAGALLAGAGPAAAQSGVVYAAVSGSGSSCTQADPCELSTALTTVTAGEAVQLVTAGGAGAGARYVGNWTVSTAGTSATQPVTIEPAPGLPSP
jgi:hypothetical protein